MFSHCPVWHSICLLLLLIRAGVVGEKKYNKKVICNRVQREKVIMNSKKLERYQKGSLSSSTTNRSSTVIDDADAHESNTKKFSPCCLVGNWPGDKLKQDVSFTVENYIQFLNLSHPARIVCCSASHWTWLCYVVCCCCRDRTEISASSKKNLSRNSTNKSKSLLLLPTFSLPAAAVAGKKCKQHKHFCLLQHTQENLREFLEKRERGELLVQKTARLHSNFLAPTQLSSSTTSVYVSFDQAIQLIAVDMPKIHSNFSSHTTPIALSVVVNEPHINRCQEIDEHCEMSCAHTLRPTARNTFIIRRSTMASHRRCNKRTSMTAADSQYLKYGQDFMLECCESKHRPLLLYSSPQSPFGGASSASAHSDYVFKVHGEMKQSVGLALLKGQQHVPASFFIWRMYHINPDVRYETIGENIPVSLSSARFCLLEMCVSCTAKVLSSCVWTSSLTSMIDCSI